MRSYINLKESKPIKNYCIRHYKTMHNSYIPNTIKGYSQPITLNPKLKSSITKFDQVSRISSFDYKNTGVGDKVFKILRQAYNEKGRSNLNTIKWLVFKRYKKPCFNCFK